MTEWMDERPYPGPQVEPRYLHLNEPPKKRLEVGDIYEKDGKIMGVVVAVTAHYDVVNLTPTVAIQVDTTAFDD